MSGVKFCPKCKQEISVDLFAKNKTKKDGLGSECKSCAAARAKKWAEDNPERVREWRDSHYKATKEKQKARAKAWHHSNKERAKATGIRYRTANAEKIKAKKRFDSTGFTRELWEQALTEQNHRCAICRCDLKALPSRKVHADHDHLTGAPRGVLCHHCNVAIGHLKESPILLRAAIEYLESPPLKVMP